MHQNGGVVATWADTGKVHVYDLTSVTTALQNKTSTKKHPGSPQCSFDGHSQEGFALDWSPVVEGRLATGGCGGGIFLWNMAEGGEWEIDQTPYQGHSSSVEDLQWSSIEPSVFMSASADGSVAVWDVRGRSGPMIQQPRCHGGSDVNVISWNKGVSHLFASGGDDGSFKIWDLRSFPSDSPIGHFTYHKQPITSIQWDQHDDSMLTVASEDHDITTWDLSVEVDDEEERSRREQGDPSLSNLPPQLLFIHQGQTHVKEVRYHPQIPRMVMSTSLEGFNMYIPAIEISEEEDEEQQQEEEEGGGGNEVESNDIRTTNDSEVNEEDTEGK